MDAQVRGQAADRFFCRLSVQLGDLRHSLAEGGQDGARGRAIEELRRRLRLVHDVVGKEERSVREDVPADLQPVAEHLNDAGHVRAGGRRDLAIQQ